MHGVDLSALGVSHGCVPKEAAVSGVCHICCGSRKIAGEIEAEGGLIKAIFTHSDEKHS